MHLTVSSQEKTYLHRCNEFVQGQACVWTTNQSTEGWHAFPAWRKAPVSVTLPKPLHPPTTACWTPFPSLVQNITWLSHYFPHLPHPPQFDSAIYCTIHYTHNTNGNGTAQAWCGIQMLSIFLQTLKHTKIKHKIKYKQNKPERCIQWYSLKPHFIYL